MISSNIEIPLEEFADKTFDFKELFGKERVEAEIGFCSGHFLSEYANSKPDTGLPSITAPAPSRRWIVFASTPAASVILLAALPVGAVRVISKPFCLK